MRLSLRDILFSALAALLLVVGLLAGNMDAADSDQEPEVLPADAAENAAAGQGAGNPFSVSSGTGMTGGYDAKLRENRLVYDQDRPDSVVTLYLTVTEDNLTAEHPMTWTEMHRIANAQDNDKATIKVNAIVQEGTAEGPQTGMFGFGETRPNAVVKLRGKSTIRAAQKSYKIDLFDSAGLWRDQQSINLVKSAFELTRMRNKLSFDFLKEIPHMTSLRTQFVHLYVKDLTTGLGADFEDYGLYTQIEQPNKSFLRTHGLDPYGQFYKAENFEFFRYPDKLKLTDDPGFNRGDFESVLEVKGYEDHAKLLGMLDDVNNMMLDIDEVFEKHFDRDNFFTWLAVNILMDNIDTNTQNYYLYSPLNSDKWFFLPWDYDGAWGFYESPGQKPQRRPPWQRGIHNYWGSVLFNRLFKNPSNVEELTAKIKELGAIINPEQTRRKIETYQPIVSQFVRREPDIRFLPGPLESYDSELERLIGLPAVNERMFAESLEAPMPFYLGDVKVDGAELEFVWSMSYDLQGDSLIYRMQVAKEPSFSRPLVDREGLTGTTIRWNNPGPGRYFWRVTVADTKGNSMTAFDELFHEDGVVYHGVREFYID